MTKYVVVMDDSEVRNEDFDESEIPSLLESGYVLAVLKSVDNEIRYAVLDWEQGIVKDWGRPKPGDD